MEITLFNLCKYTTPNLQKKIVGFIVLFIRIWNPKKNVIALLVTPILFFVICQICFTWTTFKVSYNFLIVTNLGCINSMCVFKGVTPLHLLYFINHFLIIKTTFGQNIINCLFGPIDNASQHSKFTMSTWRLCKWLEVKRMFT